MAASFQPNSAAFFEIVNSEEVKAALHAIAEKGIGYAEAISAEFTDTGDYIKNFGTEDVKAQVGRTPPRNAVLLVNNSNHAAAVEYGYHGRAKDEDVTSAHNVLSRTAGFLEGDA